MKTLALQLITVDLEDGERGVFIGCPLISEEQQEHDGHDGHDGHVEDIWFSNIQEVPESLTVGQLMELVRRQTCSCRGQLH